jgi:hypothetical protein
VKNIVNVQAFLEECYPSLRINIWCYPTSRVSLFLVFIFGEWFGLFLFIGLFLKYIFISIQVLNNWYHSTFLGQRREEFLALFAYFF